MRTKKIFAGVLSAAMALSAMTVLPMNASAELLVENTFETDYEGWTNLGEATMLSAEAGAAHSSGRGMSVTGRQSAADGAASEKGFYLEGGYNYDYSVWVQAATAEHFKLALTWRYADNTTKTAVIAECDAEAGEWTELRCDYKAPRDTVNLTLSLTTDSTADFSFDDVTVTGAQAVHGKGEILAAAADLGLKDIYANHFRVGTCMPGHAINNSTITGIVLREFNSVTCENELKPDATLVQNGSTNDNIKVSLNSAAGIIDFCIKNNIAMRGHTLVWHSQTPSWFFRSDFNNGSFVDKNTMNGRMESYIKNMFGAIETQYPSLNLYAYDVANECIADGSSGPRQPAENGNGGGSAWVKVYGDNSFVKQAFTYAKKYRPEGCKLFYNDYNEYENPKMTGIINLVTELKQADLIDGMGMQSHLSANYPSVSMYTSALNTYADLLGCVHITELDIGGADPNTYGGIMQAALERPEVEAFVVWGTTDSTSWRSETSPLLFDGSGNKKAAYNKLASMIPESEYGDGNNPVTGGMEIKPIEPDADGCFYHNTFESGEESWSGRGDASAVQNTQQAFKGSGSLSVSGRTDNWNGTARSLSTNPFKPGETFSFGAMVKYTEGEATEDIKLTLQYNANGEENYAEIALATVTKGEWTLISNDSYTIPEGATGMLIYLEAPDSLIDFYVDEAYGGVQGAAPVDAPAVTTTAPPETTTESTTVTTTSATAAPAPSKLGDVDCSGIVDVSDAVLLARFTLSDPDAGVTEDGLRNADVNKSGAPDSDDVILIVQYLAGIIADF